MLSEIFQRKILTARLVRSRAKMLTHTLAIRTHMKVQEGGKSRLQVLEKGQ